MAFGDRLIHSLVIERPVTQLDSGEVLLDEYGHPERDHVELTTVRGLPQPKKAEEVALISQGGAALSDYVIYTFPTDLTSADRIRHTAAACPVPDAADLPDSLYELAGEPRNAAGVGHHLETDARLVKAPTETEESG